MTRVYFWVKGVNPNRKNGPWWFTDFRDAKAADLFIKTLKPFCEHIGTERPVTYTEWLDRAEGVTTLSAQRG